MRGFENLPREYIEKINFYIDYSKKRGELVSEQKSAEKKINGNDHKPSIQNYIKEQVSIYASEIEQSIDSFFDNDYEPTINVYDWLVSKEVKGLIAKKIANLLFKDSNKKELIISGIPSKENNQDIAIDVHIKNMTTAVVFTLDNNTSGKSFIFMSL